MIYYDYFLVRGGSLRVSRGFHLSAFSHATRSACRDGWRDSFFIAEIGFRLVLPQ